MITKNRVVLVLGAGASAPYDFPLGQGLVERIKSVKGDPQRLGQFTKSTKGAYDHTAVNEFCDTLARSGWKSIDRFLQHREDLEDLGKAMIAFQLLQCEQLSALRTPRKPENDRWYRYLYNDILNPRAPEDLGANAFGVITYNYDRSLEKYLFDALQAGFNLSQEDAVAALQALPIVHVHGSFGVLPGAGPAPRHYDGGVYDAVEAARNLHIISNEIESSGVLDDCENLLAEANQVVFLGFGFDPVNVRRLRLDRHRHAVYQGTVFGLEDSEIVVTVRKQFSDMGLTLLNTHPDVDCLKFLRQSRHVFV